MHIVIYSGDYALQYLDWITTSMCDFCDAMLALPAYLLAIMCFAKPRGSICLLVKWTDTAFWLSKALVSALVLT